MARILVADDNSNIQKMVGLALKDQGIDVVAVGNGEAAVRKISDIRPDLVLADVFMPVRNGYEVCQYVKADSSLAHIPVILLVGAFDPLDEQEAQRVGADGVLKKPFVPPDPLISMVKSALARAGVSIGGVPAAPPPAEEPIRVADMLAPRGGASRGLSSMGSVPEIPVAESEPVPEELPELPAPVHIDAGSQPLAFGSLLETPAAETEDDLGFATTPRPELERDWKSGDKEDEVEEEEEEESSASWRRDAGSEMEEDGEAAAAPTKDWRETAFSEGPARKMRDNSWAPQKELSSLEEAAGAEQTVTAMVSDAPRAAAPIAPFSEDSWATALSEKTVAEAANVSSSVAVAPSEPAVEAPAPQQIVEPVVNAAPASVVEHKQEAEKPASASGSWFSSVTSPWEAEAQKASRLASTWDTPAASAPANTIPEVASSAPKEDPAATVDNLSAPVSEAVKAKLEEVPLPAAAVEAIREEAQHVTETVVQEAPAASSTAKAPETSMEDMVAKVLGKMSPDMLQAVTREILKPVIEAMVRDELNAKK